MFNLSASNTFLLYRHPTDMRKGFDGLSGLVCNELGRNPLSGEVFVFINKPRNRIKLLHWEYGGFTLYYKRLEKGRLELPSGGDQSLQISWTDLLFMIEGVQLKSIKKLPRFTLKNSA